MSYFYTHLDTTPPYWPFLCLAPNPSIINPSFHQERFAGGLAEADSHVSITAFPALIRVEFVRTLVAEGGTERK